MSLGLLAYNLTRDTSKPYTWVMYEACYRFNRPPFSLTPDPEFLYKSPSHQAALEQLLRGIRRREGFLLLTADTGTGKTTIWRTVIEQLGPKMFTAVVRSSFSSEEELLLAMLQDFGVVSPADVHQGRLAGASKQQLVDTLNDFLRSLTPLGATCSARAAPCPHETRHGSG